MNKVELITALAEKAEVSKKDAVIQELTAKLAHAEALLNRDGNNTFAKL